MKDMELAIVSGLRELAPTAAEQLPIDHFGRELKPKVSLAVIGIVHCMYNGGVRRQDVHDRFGRRGPC